MAKDSTPSPTGGRRALITGAGRGIGAAIANRLIGQGLHVAGTYRSSATGLAELAERAPERVLALPYELGDNQSAHAAIKTITERWGGLDSLVLNAGQWRGGFLEDIADEDWAALLHANVVGAAQLTRAALPALRTGTAPSVLLVSSVVGLIGYAGDTAYASAKAAYIGLARSLAKEVGRSGIRVNVLAPGFVETDMTAQVPDIARQRILRETVLRRFGTVDEVADAAVFLEGATYCTGTVLTVDGGWSL